MSTSTTDYQTLVNRVLLDCSESETDNIFEDSPVTRKFRNFVVMALHDIANSYDWSWLYKTNSAGVAWTNERAVINDMVRIYAVQYNGVSLTPMSYRIFLKNTLYPINSSGYVAVHNYAQADDNAVVVNPYPTTAEERALFIFAYIRRVSVPSTASEVFSFPERYVTLLHKRAVYYAMLRHVHDMEQAQMAEKDYEVALQQLVSRERVPAGVNRFNIYGGY